MGSFPFVWVRFLVLCVLRGWSGIALGRWAWWDYLFSKAACYIFHTLLVYWN